MDTEEKKLTKDDMIQFISQKYNIHASLAKQIIQDILDSIINALCQGKKVEFRRFGIWKVVTQKARIARNIKKNTSFLIPPRKVVKFRQGSSMGEKITHASISGENISTPGGQI